MASFKIGINMAGAVSAGAYTAGVLDFMTEALDAWYAAKAGNAPVPRHDVSIEVFSGASAGGMCAAISAVLLQQDFEHIDDAATAQETTNRLYESWVNKVDIAEMLKTNDLQPGQPVVSLLNSDIITEIAEYAVQLDNMLTTPRAYVSPDLTLFLSLTNLRGTPYSLNSVAPGSIEETTLFFGDRICFRTRRGKADGELDELNVASPTAHFAHTLDLTDGSPAGGWTLLQRAAMATGAFPVFLAPRVLERFKREYLPSHWLPVNSEVPGTPPGVPPNFPADLPDPFQTLNVDGGITNNDPFNFAHDYLASVAPAQADGRNPPQPLDADRAVINIAPFPTTDLFQAAFDPKKASSVFWALPKLFSALISQSRFFGESLSDIMNGRTFSRFIIAPSDEKLAKAHRASGKDAAEQPPALQCGLLGAFGGFLARQFRAHDYALGRRNCQKFLRDSFVLPAGNPIMQEAWAKLDDAGRVEIQKTFGRPAPGTYARSAEELKELGAGLPAIQAAAGELWLPIIPLCGAKVSADVPEVERAKMTREELDAIVALILARWKALIPLLIDTVSSWSFRQFLQAGQPAIRWLMRRPLREMLIKALGDSYQA